MEMNLKFLIAVLFTSLLLPRQSMGAAIEDSGWVNLIKPDFEGLYSFLKSRGIDNNVHRPVFSITDQNEIYCDVDSGHIGTQRPYSHYRMRVQFLFGDKGPGAWGTNAGIMYHIDESAPYMSNWWPQSIEAQLKTDEVGAVYSIQGVTFDLFKAPDANRYLPVEEGGVPAVCSNEPRNFAPYENHYNAEGWTDYEIVVRGSERAEHWVMGNKVMEITNIRLNDSPYRQGNVALQVEVKEIWYRNWHIMELHPDGPDRLPVITFTNPDTTQGISTEGEQTINWGVAGEVDSVALAYSEDGSNWVSITTNAASPYQWTVPALTSETVHLKASAWDGMASRVIMLPVIQTGIISPHIEMGEGFTLTGFTGQNIYQVHRGKYQQIEIYSLQGEMMRILDIRQSLAQWDGLILNRTAAEPGIYFARAKGNNQVLDFMFYHY